jgi:hypothetical protein
MDEDTAPTVESLLLELERLAPSDYFTTMFPDRPYNGQPHTDTGERGRTEVTGLTFRDLRDCYIRAQFLSSGLPPGEWPNSVHELPDRDPLAVFQNMACEIERKMGIFPNCSPHFYHCEVCGIRFGCDARKAYECPHDHGEERRTHLRTHPEAGQ